MSNRKNISVSKKGLILKIFIPIVLLAGVLFLCYLYLTNSFKPAPKMEVKANNSYSETIRVVTDIDYAPFSYVDENGEYAGLDVELMNEIANRLEVNLEFTLMDWNKANEIIKSGEADIIMNMETDLVTPESGLIATIPTNEKQYVAYGRKPVRSVLDLYGKRIASLHKLPALEMDITYINSYQQIFEGLQAGEYDYAICPIQVGNAFLEKLEIKDIYPSYAVGHVYGALAFPADRTELRDKINPILKSLQDEGFLSSLDAKWVNHRYEYTSVSSVIQNHPVFALALIFCLLLIVVLAFLYIITQRSSNAAKKIYTKQIHDSLEAVKAAHKEAYLDRLTGIRNRNAYKDMAESIQAEIENGTVEPFAVTVCDINGLKQVNDALGHKAGDRLIKEACGMICRVYSHSSVFRIGGDEFVVILKGEDYAKRYILLKQMSDTAIANQKTGGIVIACGMSSYENDKKSSAVFERADKEMYKNKAALKKQEGDNPPA